MTLSSFDKQPIQNIRLLKDVNVPKLALFDLKTVTTADLRLNHKERFRALLRNLIYDTLLSTSNAQSMFQRSFRRSTGRTNQQN
jgi:hypothetical protein